jgi:predicted Zn-dependent protease
MIAARLLLVIPALMGLGWMSAQALRVGSADSIVYEAAKEMSTWMASGSSPAEQTMGWVHGDLQRAAARVPSDPSVQELLGLLQSRRIDRAEYADEAVVHFVKALELRPTSPYTWGNLAEAKYRKGDTAETFEAALRRAAEMGPGEPEVQRTVADFGLAVFKEVTPATRVAIERMVASGMSRNPMEMLQIAQRRGRLDTACRQLANSPRGADSKWSQLCQSTEASP